MCDRIHSIECIVPPFMLQNIVANGTDLQREYAEENLVVSEQMRVQRSVATAVPPLPKAVADGKERIVYDAQGGSALPGVLARSEGQGPTGDAAVDEAYDGAGATYDLYHDVYGRDSIDNLGMRLESTVHYKQGYDNAFWNGQRMVYGDGDENLPEDQRLFNRFTIALDIIGHELTHGVTQYEAGLVYRNQSGALNESMSDVFGVLVKQRLLNQTAAEADWLIGAGLFTPNVQGVALRSMKAPGTAYDDPVIGRDPQPGHMDDFVETERDNGGVHINSGIPSRAFYVAALELGGFAWEKAGQIWYATLSNHLRPDSNFMDAANFTFMVAGELYGRGSLEQQAVRTGWSEVGLIIDEGQEPPKDPSNGKPTPPEEEGCLSSVASLAVLRSLFGRK